MEIIVNEKIIVADLPNGSLFLYDNEIFIKTENIYCPEKRVRHICINNLGKEIGFNPFVEVIELKILK
jgi:hypothetical protein